MLSSGSGSLNVEWYQTAHLCHLEFLQEQILSEITEMYWISLRVTF